MTMNILVKLATIICVLFFIENVQPIRHSREIQEISVGGKNYNISRMTPIPKDYDQCYVSVMVYDSITLTSPTEGATVTVVSVTGANSNPSGFSQSKTDKYGQACVLVKCYVQGIIYVENDGERLFAANLQAQRLNLPPAFRVDILSHSEEIKFHSFVFGTVLGQTGPVYNSRDFDDCLTNARNHHHFSFSYLSIPDQLVSTPVPTSMPMIDASFIQNPSSNLIWLYGLPGGARTCYLKLKIKVGNDPVIINLRSRLRGPTGPTLGLFVTGPKPDPVNPTDDKLACLMFRCPVEDIILTNQQYPTYIEGSVTGVSNCSIKGKSNPYITINKLQFNGTIPVIGQLSPKDGLFQNEEPGKARARCFTGNDFLGETDSFEVENNIAFEYDCTV